MDLLLDLRIPGVTPAQFGLVEPDLDTRFPQGVTDARDRLHVLGAVREEDGTGGG
jgi:hypothetical protein